MRKASILVISYHFYPSHEVGAKRPSETALHFARQGYDVTVLRGWRPGFAQRADIEPIENLSVLSVTIPRRRITELWIAFKQRLGRQSVEVAASARGEKGDSPRARRSVLRWVRRQLLAFDTLFQGEKRWLLASVLKLLVARRGRRYDLVIASGPPMVSYICGYLVAKLKRTRLLLDYRDPWYLHGDPELTTVMLGHPLARLENALARSCAHRCGALVAASPGTKRHILERFEVPEERVHVVRNGFDAHAVVKETPPVGRLEMLYAGSLYWNRNPFPFLEALRELLTHGALDRERVRCRLVGNCEAWKDIPLRPWIEQAGMQNVVEILPFMAPLKLRELVADSNVLINFAQGQKRQIPAKSYDYIAAGRDVLVIAEADGDVADLFRDARIGRIVDPEDGQGFADAIRFYYARHALAENAAESSPRVDRYAREAQLESFERIVERVLDQPKVS